MGSEIGLDLCFVPDGRTFVLAARLRFVLATKLRRDIAAAEGRCQCVTCLFPCNLRVMKTKVQIGDVSERGAEDSKKKYLILIRTE
jgi:hypothetical protein